MKSKIFKNIFFLLVLTEIFSSCAKTRDNPVYYVVGYDTGSGVEIHEGTAKSGGYVFISENLQDTLYASNLKYSDRFFYLSSQDLNDDSSAIGNLFDDLFAFPAEIMPTNICGKNFFPEEYRFAYKVQMSYRLIEEEGTYKAIPICFGGYYQPYPFLYPKRVVITSISKSQ